MKKQKVARAQAPLMTPGAVGVALALLAAPAGAVRFDTEGGVQVDFSSTISVGTQVRLANPARSNVGNDNGGAVPTAGAIGGRVAGAGDPLFSNPDFNFLPLLNFEWVSSAAERVKGGRRPGAAAPLTRHGQEHAGTRPSPAL